MRLLALAALCLLQACSTPPPPTPTGPTATIADTAIGGGASGGTFFFVSEIGGLRTANTLDESLRASYGQGANLRIVPFERPVAAGRTRLKLKATAAYAMPIQQIFSSRPDPVEGSIEVELVAGTRYRVNGVLDALRREVWIEEAASGRIVGGKISAAPSAEATRAAAGEAAYTCCNLHHEDDWISDANWSTLPFIPAGTPIKVYDVERQKSKAMIDGKPMWIGLEYGRKQQTMQALLARIAVKEDPRLRMANWAAPVQAAITSGKVAVGMTEEQVIVALGYPRADTTLSLELPRWAYHTFEEEPFFVVWDGTRRVSDVEAALPQVRSRMLATQAP